MNCKYCDVPLYPTEERDGVCYECWKDNWCPRRNWGPLLGAVICIVGGVAFWAFVLWVFGLI